MSDNTFQQEKTYEALAFFASHTLHAGELKLYKLLYYLDLLHFRRTGMMVTALQYEAWPKGPVPAALYGAVHNAASELHRFFDISAPRRIDFEQSTTIDSDTGPFEMLQSGTRYIPSEFVPKTPYKHHYLTRREQRLAEQIAEIFYDADAATMTDVSHNKFGPWKKALQRAKQSGSGTPTIDFLEGVVAAGDPKEELPMDELRDIIQEREAALEALR